MKKYKRIAIPVPNGNPPIPHPKMLRLCWLAGGAIAHAALLKKLILKQQQSLFTSF
jgi:hypothetical protein